MKLKEKLAEEYYLKSDNEFSDELSFVAGFEKAREMARNEFEGSWNKYQGYEFRHAWNLVSQDLQSIGEEEVEVE
jgi:hypothetical protein